MGAVFIHQIGAEVFWFERFALDREIAAEDKELLMWGKIDVDEGRWPDAPSQPLSWYLALHDRFRTRTLDAIKLWPPAETMKEHHGRLCSLRWVLGHVIQHEAYHGGQIVLLHDLWMNRVEA